MTMQESAKYLMLMCGAASASLSAANKVSERPNVLYIMCDDMGYGDLGCYGQQQISTPNIDSLARSGMMFLQAYAGSPVSAPSRACLMTGQHSGHTAVRGNKEYWASASMVQYGNCLDYSVVGQEPYDPRHVILPEIMKDNGYTTGMFGKWAGGYEGSASTPDRRGIDEFFGYLCQFQAHLYYPNFLNRFSKQAGDSAVRRIVLEDNIKHRMFGDDYFNRTQYSADIIHREAMRWIERQTPGKPFFGLLTYTLPHAELAQPHDSIFNHYTKQFFVDCTWGGDEDSRYNPSDHTHAHFAAMITRLDAYVGEIVALLKQKQLYENTIIVFTSDNGPHEEGGADPEFFGRDGKLRGLKRQCLEGGIRVPYIVCWHGHTAPGSVSNHQMAFYDVMPTLCDIIGVKNYTKRYARSANDTFDGLSFAPTLTGKGVQPKHPHLYWEFHETDQIAVRQGDWKLLVIAGKPHLYNLADDVHEDHDVAALHPEKVKELIEIVLKEHTPSKNFKITLPQI